jgi:hypothetical protein
MEEYTIKYRELNAKFKEWKIKECERISQLKIVIPMEFSLSTMSCANWRNSN